MLADGYTKEQMGLMLAIPLAATQAIGSSLTVFIIEKVGRRNLMLRTLPFVCISLVLSVFVFNNTRLLAILFLIIMLFHSLALSTTPWVIATEIFPLHLVSTGCCISSATYWFSRLIFASFELNELTLGCMAVASAAATGFVWMKVPETGGRRIEENVRNILGRNNIWWQLKI